MVCKGICKKYESAFQIYRKNFKKCNNCNIKIKWDGYRCPCCNGSLRSRSASGKRESEFVRL